MHASWNQWTGSVAPQVPSYGTAFSQGAAPPAAPFTSVNPFQVNPTPPVTTPAVSTPYQAPLYGQPPPPPQPSQTPQQQQQWQQWEQWQQQYAQWHQQYGDKYQGPLPTNMLPPAMPTVPSAYSSMPPLPPGAPTAQPPPPDTVPPPSTDKSDTEAGKRASQDGGKEETKKQKTGKGKAETVEDLVEQEKTFDEQFKTWETSFIKWKEQNANHPDKTQYKEYEAKWESWREQLIQKREQLRKKRETKEAEVAAAAAAAKEAALATSSNATGYSTAAVTQSNPYLASNMMYPMAGMYATQGLSQMASQTQNFMASYPLYNMPPPTGMPPLPMMPPVAGHDQKKEMDSSKTNQSLEFLSSSSSSATNAKSIPGLDLVGSDKPAAPPAVSSIPPTSTLFSYNQDVTKPLHTSDDKPFNFPAPPQSNNYTYNDQSRNQYSSFSLSRPPPTLPSNQNQFQKNYSYDQRNEPNDYPDDRNRFEDKFGNRRGANTKFDNYGPPIDSRNEPAFDKGSKFGSTTYKPTFNSEKYAKYYEDEYDDSRFRDPEPSESPQHNASKFNNYGRNDRDNYSNYRQNNFGNRGGFSNKFDDYQRDFNDQSNNRQEMGRGRGRFGARPPYGDGNNMDSSNSFSNRYGGFGRGQSNDNSRPGFNSWQSNDSKAPPERFDNATMDKSIPGKPVSLLDLPMMKPPDTFENKPFGDETSEPFGSDKGPFGGDKVPFGGDKGPFDSDTGPFGGDKGQFGGDKGPFSNEKGPFGSEKGPFGGDKGPFGSDKGPFGGDKGPFSGDKGPFGSDKGPFGSDKGPGGIPISEDSRFGPNAPPPFKGPPFGDTDNSRFGPKNSNSFFDGSNGRSAPDSNFPSQGSFPPPKSLPNASDLKNRSEDGAGVGDKPAPREEIIEDLKPSLFFDYQHFKKTSAESLPSSFDAVYIFDYGHGKKKAVDNKDFIESLASEVKANDKNTWEGEPWQDEKKPEEKAEPLPQRTKANTDLTKELAAILNKSENHAENPKEARSNNADEKKSTSVPWHRDTSQETPAKKDEPMEIQQTTTTAPAKPVVPESTLLPPSKLIDDLLLPPGRHSRPIKLVIIMRGPPGSGKTFTAKLIKDKEVEMGGGPPRILSLDDYFTVENDVEETDPSTGKKITKKAMVYEYEAEMEPTYHDSLVKSFKKNVGDGFFPFIIVDCVNDKVKKYEDMYSFALSKGFQVFVCEMDVDLSTCVKRNIHSRTEDDIKKVIDGWEKTPPSQTILDIRSLLQSAAITEVDMVDAEEEKETPPKEEPSKEVDKPEQKNDDKEEPAAETSEPEKPAEEEAEAPEKEGFSSYMDILCTSKWEKSENTEEKLDRLDGVSKKRSSTTFKEWLQLPEDETDLSWYASNDKTAAVAESNVPRKKRVRWADLEERVAQQKMRAIGFVVGQTDWKRMMDPSFGGSKLTQTKYIYK